MMEHDALPFEQFAGFSYDQWMVASAGIGIALLLLYFYGVMHGWGLMDHPSLRYTRNVAYVLIAIPLFSRWFLSSSLLFSIGVCMVAVSGIKLLLLRKGV